MLYSCPCTICTADTQFLPVCERDSQFVNLLLKIYFWWPCLCISCVCALLLWPWLSWSVMEVPELFQTSFKRGRVGWLRVVFMFVFNNTLPFPVKINDGEVWLQKWTWRKCILYDIMILQVSGHVWLRNCNEFVQYALFLNFAIKLPKVYIRVYSCSWVDHWYNYSALHLRLGFEDCIIALAWVVGACPRPVGFRRHATVYYLEESMGDGKWLKPAVCCLALALAIVSFML